MIKKPNSAQNYLEVEAALKAAMERGPGWGELSFDTGVLGDMLHGQLVDTWHLLSEKTKDVMMVVLAELYMHSDAERLSDEKAAELVKCLRGR